MMADESKVSEINPQTSPSKGTKRPAEDENDVNVGDVSHDLAHSLRVIISVN